ncbi:hypothetical protein ACFYZE_15845 [Streptomyces sp. NPDC001796]|uniref:hypothetical protein n=1 Tax=Streptomyces sp. NPDC001796 TaxID=3364609 RepID=UPI00369B2052
MTTDRCPRFAGTAPGRCPTHRPGLPQPAPPRRWSPGRPALSGPLLHLTAGESSAALARGGLPAGVAETTARLAHPASGAVHGQVVGVCGQSLLGA